MTDTDVPVVDGWTLRPWGEQDLDAFEALATDPTICEYLGEIEDEMPEQTRVAFAAGGYFYCRAAIVHVDDPATPVGMVMAGGHDTVNLDIGIAGAHQGRGAGAAAVRIVNRLVRQLQPESRVVGTVRHDNARCLAMLDGLGIATSPSPDDDEYLNA